MVPETRLLIASLVGLVRCLFRPTQKLHEVARQILGPKVVLGGYRTDEEGASRVSEMVHACSLLGGSGSARMSKYGELPGMITVMISMQLYIIPATRWSGRSTG